MASLMIRWLAMALMAVTVALMGESGPGVARADYYLDFHTPYLLEGETLEKGLILGGVPLSLEDRYGLHLQQDCNLVLYRDGSSNALWASNTAGRAQQCTLIRQFDCNAVLYDSATQNALWESGTSGGGSGCKFQVQLDGNVVVYRGDGVALWATNTVQP